jgi:hypothetical protein
MSIAFFRLILNLCFLEKEIAVPPISDMKEKRTRLSPRPNF